MNKTISKILLCFLFPTIIGFSQQSRLSSLGGLSYSVVDIDSKIDPYIFGNNPAWLVKSRKSERLEISPSWSNDYGSYHRHFDSDNIHNYNIGFVGIKPLGESGTFKGSAFYDYQLQKNRNRALTLETYSGDAFFFVDTTSGDFRYSGPTFEFMHSLQLYDNLYFGASVRYKILDGLKRTFSYAQSLYRNVSGNIGLAYNVSDKLTFGIHYYLFDGQERIEAKDINKLTVNAFMYRGHTYKVDKSGTSPDYKLKKSGQSINFQVYSQPYNNLDIGLNVKYYLHNSGVILKDRNLEYEDGYSDYGTTDVELRAKWLQSKNITFGFSGGYLSTNSWSKNSQRNLLLWKWKLSDIFVGLGGSVKLLKDKLLLGAEFELHSISTDSSKYIDTGFSEISGLNNIIRIGGEYNLSEKISIRLGYNLYLQEYDFVYGGSNTVGHKVSGGLRYLVSEQLEIDATIKYGKINERESMLYKNNLGVFTTLRFFSF